MACLLSSGPPLCSTTSIYIFNKRNKRSYRKRENEAHCSKRMYTACYFSVPAWDPHLRVVSGDRPKPHLPGPAGKQLPRNMLFNDRDSGAVKQAEWGTAKTVKVDDIPPLAKVQDGPHYCEGNRLSATIPTRGLRHSRHWLAQRPHSSLFTSD